MTVITRVELRPEVADEWDATMTERMRAAESAPGWIAGRILASSDSPGQRVIIGVWDKVEDWSAWHHDPSFERTRERLDELGVRSGETEWYRSVYEASRD